MAADGNGLMALEPKPKAVWAEAAALTSEGLAAKKEEEEEAAAHERKPVGAVDRSGGGWEESELSAVEVAGSGASDSGLDVPSSESIKAEADESALEEGSEEGSDSPRDGEGREDGEAALWLPRLLEGDFFCACEEHADLKKNECNLFCLDCADSRASRAHVCCQHCTPDHVRHSMVQIRKYVYRDVIRLADIQKLCDPSGIPTYVINGARVIFLQPRLDQPKVKHGARPGSSAQSVCEGCERPVAGNNRFCSLSCKHFVGLPLKSKAEIEVSGWISPVSVQRVSSGGAPKQKRARSRSSSPVNDFSRSRKSRNSLGSPDVVLFKRRKSRPFRAPAASGRPGQIVFNY